MLRHALIAIALWPLAACRADRGPDQAAADAADSRLQTAAGVRNEAAQRLGVVLVEDARFPLVTVRLNFQAARSSIPKDMPGLAEAVAALLIEGTKTRTARQISEETRCARRHARRHRRRRFADGRRQRAFGEPAASC